MEKWFREQSQLIQWLLLLSVLGGFVVATRQTDAGNFVAAWLGAAFGLFLTGCLVGALVLGVYFGVVAPLARRIRGRAPGR